MNSSHNLNNLLFVGHDLKFLTSIVNYFSIHSDFRVANFSYEGHIIKQTEELQNLLPKFNLVFCEWGLHNIEWMSHNKLDHQKLIVRIHLQEFRTNYLERTNWNNVDRIIFISQFQLERFVKIFPDTASKCQLIYNYVDCDDFRKNKLSDVRFNLGQVGILPMRKSPHLAVEILNQLKQSDSRYKLFIKSKKPEELGWLWKQPDERAYYDQLYNLINQYNLEQSVVFEGFDSNVTGWFQNIGFLLSTSEFEGSHQSVAEAMAAGSIPIIRNWDGAATLYPSKFVFSDLSDAAALIQSYFKEDLFSSESIAVADYAMQHFDLSTILSQYRELFESL